MGKQHFFSPPPAAPPRIRTATLDDLLFVLHLQRKFSNNLGFLPTQALEEYLEAGHVHLVLENDTPAGYVATRRRLLSARWCRPITQAAICTDAQRRHLGLALLNHVARKAHGEFLEGMQCWIAEDLQEVEFFHAAGFVTVGSRTPDNARKRRLLLMRRSLQPFEPAGFHTMPAVAGCVPRRLSHALCRGRPLPSPPLVA